MEIEKVLKKQERKRKAEIRELDRMEREHTRWCQKLEKEKKRRKKFYEDCCRHYSEKFEKEGVPKDPNGNLRTIMRETYRANIGAMNAHYQDSKFLRFMSAIFVLGVSTVLMWLIIVASDNTLTKEFRVSMLIIAGSLAIFAYFFAPKIDDFFGTRRKLRIAAECKVAYELMEAKEPLSTE